MHRVRFGALFFEVLKRCRRAALVKLRRVAIDGTKVRALAAGARVAVEVDGWGMLERYVEAGIGVSVVPNLVASASDQLAVVELDAPFPALSFGVCTLRDRLLTAPARRCLEVMAPDAAVPPPPAEGRNMPATLAHLARRNRPAWRTSGAVRGTAPSSTGPALATPRRVDSGAAPGRTANCALGASGEIRRASVGGQYIVTIALAVLAFTTILGWSYYGERCWRYLFRERNLVCHRALWVLAALSFANVRVDLVWSLSDTLNGLMAVPNLIGLLPLAPMVFKVTREYFEARGESLV